MRTDKSFKNALIAIISNAVLIVISFISQAVFKNCLGQDYLGLNGLFTSIVSMLGIVELGLGSALIYHLYRPVAEQDIEKIITLMRFYRISYRIIAAAILCAGLCLIPVLHFFVSTELSINIYYIFSLFVVDTACSYLLSYKRSILYANQENYIVTAIHIGYVLFMNVCQIIVLLETRDYIVYLWLKVIFRIIENIVVTIVANRRYPYIKIKNKNKIDEVTRHDIVIKVKGLFIHKIGSYLVLGTDNIIISKFLNLAVVGMYTSYSMITSGIKNLFAQIFYSITASVGNLLVLDKGRAYEIYKDMLFFNFWLSGFCSIAFYIISKPFVVLWLGDDFVLSEYVVVIMMINLFFDTYGYTIGAFKSAAGIFHEDRWIPAFQSVINIVFSIALAYIWGLAGVIIGTIVSQMLLYLYSYPTFVYKKIFGKKKRVYYLETLKYFVSFLAAFFVTVFISGLIKFNNTFTTLCVDIIICIIIPNAIFFSLFRKKTEFSFLLGILKQRFTMIVRK